MDRAQYDAAEAVITDDCDARLYYRYGNKTCVLGALGEAAGYHLDLLKGHFMRPVTHSAIGGLVDAITARFGLSLAAQRNLQVANDGHGTAIKRRKAVRAALYREWDKQHGPNASNRPDKPIGIAPF